MYSVKTNENGYSYAHTTVRLSVKIISLSCWDFIYIIMLYFPCIQEHRTREDSSKITEDNTYSPLIHYVCRIIITTVTISIFCNINAFIGLRKVIRIDI